MEDLYRLVYTSRNQLSDNEDEQAAAVSGILAASKRNNARVGVTGALLFNGGCFAQVLEGPRAAVESTFERIQRDRRHGDVSVLQCDPVATRGFPNWSMAFVGRSERGRALWDELARRTDFDIGRIEGDRLFALLRATVETEEQADTAGSVPHGPPGRGEGLDFRRLRAELAGSRTAAPAARPAPEPEATVLRLALDEERGRTTALRRALDDAQIALATLRGELDMVGRARAVWAERARALAAALDGAAELDLPAGDVPEPGQGGRAPAPLRAV